MSYSGTSQRGFALLPPVSKSDHDLVGASWGIVCIRFILGVRLCPPNISILSFELLNNRKWMPYRKSLKATGEPLSVLQFFVITNLE